MRVCYSANNVRSGFTRRIPCAGSRRLSPGERGGRSAEQDVIILTARTLQPKYDLLATSGLASSRPAMNPSMIASISLDTSSVYSTSPQVPQIRAGTSLNLFGP